RARSGKGCPVADFLWRLIVFAVFLAVTVAGVAVWGNQPDNPLAYPLLVGGLAGMALMAGEGGRQLWARPPAPPPEDLTPGAGGVTRAAADVLHRPGVAPAGGRVPPREEWASGTGGRRQPNARKNTNAGAAGVRPSAVLSFFFIFLHYPPCGADWRM